MADVKVTRDCYVPKENVKLYVSYETNPVVLDVRRKKEGLVFDYTHGRKLASVIYLKNGELVLTALSVDTLRQRMEG